MKRIALLSGLCLLSRASSWVKGFIMCMSVRAHNLEDFNLEGS